MEKKAREIKSTWDRFLEPLADSSTPKLSPPRSLLAGFSSSFVCGFVLFVVFVGFCFGFFWPISLSQFEELLLDDPEVDAMAAPAGLLVDTDLRM